MPAATAVRTHSATCAVVRGKITASGRCFSTAVPSKLYGTRSSSSRSTASAPTMEVRAPIAASGRGIADNPLALLAEAGHAQPDLVALAQVNRRLHAVAHSRRRAGRDDVAGVKTHEAAQVTDQEGHTEDHRLGVA